MSTYLILETCMYNDLSFTAGKVYMAYRTNGALIYLTAFNQGSAFYLHKLPLLVKSRNLLILTVHTGYFPGLIKPRLSVFLKGRTRSNSVFFLLGRAHCLRCVTEQPKNNEISGNIT